MHTFLNRLNTLFAFTLTVLAVLTFGVFLSTYFEQYHGTLRISTNKAIVKHMTDFSANRKKNDLGILQLDLDMNLNSLFDWNVKELFLYLIAEYVTPANSLNQVVLWDQILLRGNNARINLHDIVTKYYFWDDGEHLRSNNVTLTLAWNVIPNAGGLPHIRANGSTSFIFPDQYTTSRLFREFLETYNRIVEECFHRCIYSFNYRYLLDEEVDCVTRCTSKYVNYNQRMAMNFADIQAKKLINMQEQVEAQSQMMNNEINDNSKSS
ncbi:unnamed protein product [Rotaria sp. Silwood2]|nr:unnamed protein product [Rotaria sp. Silwood2]CAF2745812.1 unnamed protein product [Rotaria sp. Silwood2]